MRLPANVTVGKPRHPRSKYGTYVPGVWATIRCSRRSWSIFPNPLAFRVFSGKEGLDMDESTSGITPAAST